MPELVVAGWSFILDCLSRLKTSQSESRLKVVRQHLVLLLEVAFCEKANVFYQKLLA